VVGWGWGGGLGVGGDSANGAEYSSVILEQMLIHRELFPVILYYLFVRIYDLFL
jgi:hypothetical protein